MTKLGWRVRLKGTHITGCIYARNTDTGEALYHVRWDATDTEDPRRYRAEDLESVDSQERIESPRYWMLVELDRKEQAALREQRDRDGLFVPPKHLIGHKRI